MEIANHLIAKVMIVQPRTVQMEIANLLIVKVQIVQLWIRVNKILMMSDPVNVINKAKMRLVMIIHAYKQKH